MTANQDWSQGWLGQQHVSKHDPIVRREVTRAAIALSIMAFVLAMVSGLISIDHYAGTYGIGIGTSNNYCSIEDKLPIVTCEHVR